MRQKTAQRNRIYQEQEMSPDLYSSRGDNDDPNFAKPPGFGKTKASAKDRLQIKRELDKADAEALKTDWRPLFSYTANLDRLGEAILNTDAAWVQVGRVYEQRARRGGFDVRLELSSARQRRHLAEYWVPQYPWIWSAAVLAGLWGFPYAY